MITEQLRMNKAGEWSHGKSTTRWTVDPTSLKHGWMVLDKNRDVVKEVITTMDNPRPKKPRRKYVYQVRQFTLTSSVGTVIFHTASYAGLQAVDHLIVAFMERIKKHTAKVCPVVQLRSMNYRHLTYGTIYAPKFEIVGWTGLDGVPAKRKRPSPLTDTKQKEARA